MNDAKLWKIFSQYIRLRDSNENGFCICCTCGAIRYWKDMDCGHGIPRQHMATKYDEKNNGAQCSGCNNYGRGMPQKYKEFVDKKYGKGTWDLLNFTSRTPVKYSQFEIDLLTLTYKEKVAELMKTKTLAR